MNIPQNVTELLQALVRIPSVNPQGDPGVADAGEQACAEFVGAFLRECGAEIAISEVLPRRPNIIGKFPTSSAKSNAKNSANRERKPRLIFAPHLDTVSVVGMTIDPFGAEIRDGKIFGRGASDTKGPMAAMLWALFEMREQIAALPHEIWFSGLMGEEAGQDGAKHFVADAVANRELDARDFAVIGEPTELQIVNTHKGSLWISLTTKGRAVHASAPRDGENAIYKMADVIRVIRETIEPEFTALHDPALGSPTASVGTIRGGSKINIVADHCVAEIDIRTIPANRDLFAFISEKLCAVCPDLEIVCRESKPLFTAPDHPCIHALEAAGARCAGAPWFCDAAIFSEGGIPAVALGPGSIAQAHTEDEWIAVGELERGVSFYKKFLAALR